MDVEIKYLKINNEFYRHKKHLYIKKKCEYCKQNFFCRKDKINSKTTCNRKCYQNSIELKNEYDINEHAKEIIIGSLLSDGCITKSTGGKNYYWTQTSISMEYIDLLKKEIDINLNKYVINEKEYNISNKKGIAKKAYTLKSRASVTFTKYRKIWYPNNIKIVPYDINLTPTVLLHWYLGDGYLDNGKGIVLCTDAFDYNSIFILITKLNELNMCAYYYEGGNKIIIPNKRVIEFLNYIGTCSVKYFKYKWNTNIIISYNNRECKYCHNKFDAECNHQIFCKPICAKLYSNKYKIK